MESLYQVIAILTAGVSLTMGIYSLMNYLNKGREKVNLVFGLLCLSVVTFILLPPVGFILSDNAPYPFSTKIKRIFSLSFIAFFPWFITLYTGYKKKHLQSIVTVSIVSCYLVMVLTTTNNHPKLWIVIAMAIL